MTYHFGKAAILRTQRMPRAMIVRAHDRRLGKATPSTIKQLIVFEANQLKG